MGRDTLNWDDWCSNQHCGGGGRCGLCEGCAKYFKKVLDKRAR
jgi:hypothetical protein